MYGYWSGGTKKCENDGCGKEYEGTRTSKWCPVCREIKKVERRRLHSMKAKNDRLSGQI